MKESGISPCSGVIVGMKETKEDVINMARSLKVLDADSIPVNFLHAVDGTPLEGTDELNPRYCLKVLCLFRFMNPTKEIRISGEGKLTCAPSSRSACIQPIPFLSETI